MLSDFMGCVFISEDKVMLSMCHHAFRAQSCLAILAVILDFLIRVQLAF